MSEEGRYQMLWDCAACGTGQLLALDHKFCPACGNVQSATGRYFPSDEQKVAVTDNPYAGADKVCPACDNLNGAKSEFCQACGSPLDEAKAAKVRQDRVLDADAVDAGESAKDATAEAAAARQKMEDERRRRFAGQEPEPQKKGGIGCVAWAIILFLVGGVVVCIGVVVVVPLLGWLMARSASVEVAGFAWESSIEVERFEELSREDWKASVPSKARDVRCREAKQDTKKVPDGEDCKTVKKDLGDGSFKEVKECKPKYREEPVMGQKCRYKVEDWGVNRTDKAVGTDQAPKWPTVKLAREGNCLGCEREGKRTGVYTLMMYEAATGTTHKCEVSEAVFKSVKQGSKHEAVVDGITGALDCSGVK